MSKEKRHESAGQEKRAVVSWGWSYVAGGLGQRILGKILNEGRWCVSLT